MPGTIFWTKQIFLSFTKRLKFITYKLVVNFINFVTSLFAQNRRKERKSQRYGLFLLSNKGKQPKKSMLGCIHGMGTCSLKNVKLL